MSKGKSNSFLSEKVSDTEETSRQNELILTKEKFELDVKRREEAIDEMKSKNEDEEQIKVKITDL